MAAPSILRSFVPRTRWPEDSVITQPEQRIERHGQARRTDEVAAGVSPVSDGRHVFLRAERRFERGHLLLFGIGDLDRVEDDVLRGNLERHAKPRRRQADRHGVFVEVGCRNVFELGRDDARLVEVSAANADVRLEEVQLTAELVRDRRIEVVVDRDRCKGSCDAVCDERDILAPDDGGSVDLPGLDDDGSLGAGDALELPLKTGAPYRRQVDLYLDLVWRGEQKLNFLMMRREKFVTPSELALQVLYAVKQFGVDPGRVAVWQLICEPKIHLSRLEIQMDELYELRERINESSGLLNSCENDFPYTKDMASCELCDFRSICERFIEPGTKVKIDSIN